MNKHPTRGLKNPFMEIQLIGGSRYVQPLARIQDAIDGELDGLSVGDEITLKFRKVEMTMEEYGALPEFEGH